MSTDEFDLTVSDSYETPGRRKNNFTATVAPTANEDAGDQYEVGSIWVDVTADKGYVCVDSTLTAAVWQQISGSGASGVTDANYLVGTAHAGLSAEIVVGTTPGGELGNTWASPTVDTTHSGSSHAGVITTHEAASDPHTGYVLESALAATVAALGYVGPILIADVHSTPLIFADLLQTEDGDDLIYGDT